MIAVNYYLFFHISEKYLQFTKKQKQLLGKTFGSPHTSKQIYLLHNFFWNYVYLKDMYITLKGIEKILFVSVLRILLICKFLNFTAVFTKNKTKLSRIAYDFPCEKVNFSLMHPIHIAIHGFWTTLKFLGFSSSVKVTFKQSVKNNDYWIFLTFFTLVYFFGARD